MKPNKKYAFCIIAHSQPELFKILVNQIDNIENDIFVMVDKKADITQFINVSLLYSNIYFCDKRIDIRWGEISLIKAEIELFRTASNLNEYEYYHLISGQDLLIKPVEDLNQFMQSHQGHEFLLIKNDKDSKKSVKLRLSSFHFFPRFSRSKNILTKLIFWGPIIVQKAIGFKRKIPKNLQNLMWSSQWCSITHSFVKMILSEENTIYMTFKYTACSDELYKPFIANLYGILNKCDMSSNCPEDNLRRIDWERGKPYVWTYNDFDELTTCKQFFARKFNLDDTRLLELIQNHTNRKREKFQNDQSSKNRIL